MGYLNEDGLATLVGKVKGQVVQLTAAEYRQIPAETKNTDNKIYFVEDDDYAYAIDNEPTLNSENLVKSGGVYNYTSKIGTGALTTTAQTLIPAVNELKAEVDTNTSDIATVERSSCTMESNWTTTQNRVVKKTGFVELYVECLFSGTYVSGWNKIFTVPAGYRPIETFDMVSLDNGVSTAPACDIKIEQGGAVRVYNNTGTSKNLRIHAVYIQGN